MIDYEIWLDSEGNEILIPVDFFGEKTIEEDAECLQALDEEDEEINDWLFVED